MADFFGNTYIPPRLIAERGSAFGGRFGGPGFDGFYAGRRMMRVYEYGRMGVTPFPIDMYSRLNVNGNFGFNMQGSAWGNGFGMGGPNGFMGGVNGGFAGRFGMYGNLNVTAEMGLGRGQADPSNAALARLSNPDVFRRYATADGVLTPQSLTAAINNPDTPAEDKALFQQLLANRGTIFASIDPFRRDTVTGGDAHWNGWSLNDIRTLELRTRLGQSIPEIDQQLRGYIGAERGLGYAGNGYIDAMRQRRLNLFPLGMVG